MGRKKMGLEERDMRICRVREGELEGFKWREMGRKETETTSQEIPANGCMGSSNFLKMRALLFVSPKKSPRLVNLVNSIHS